MTSLFGCTLKWKYLATTFVLISVLSKCSATTKKFKEDNDIDDLINGRTKFKKMTFDPNRKTNFIFNISNGFPLHIMLSREKKGHCEMFYMKFTDLTITRENGTQKMIVCVTELKNDNLKQKCDWVNNTENLIINQGNLYGMPYDCGPWYITVWVAANKSEKHNIIPQSNETTELSVEVSEPYDPLFYRWIRAISNLAFIPGILLAFKRKFYAEGVVYVSTFLFSSTYHLCEAELHCFKDYYRLHDSDIYCSIFSILVTIWAMTGVKPAIRHIIYVVTAIGLQFAITRDRHSPRSQLYINLVFGGIPGCMVIYKYIFYSVKYKQCYPRRKRWLTLIPGLCLGVTGVLINQLRHGGYYYWHSLWHISIMSCVAFLLPFSEGDHDDEEWFRLLEREKSTYTRLA